MFRGLKNRLEKSLNQSGIKASFSKGDQSDDLSEISSSLQQGDETPMGDSRMSSTSTSLVDLSEEPVAPKPRSELHFPHRSTPVPSEGHGGVVDHSSPAVLDLSSFESIEDLMNPSGSTGRQLQSLQSSQRVAEANSNNNSMGVERSRNSSVSSQRSDSYYFSRDSSFVPQPSARGASLALPSDIESEMDDASSVASFQAADDPDGAGEGEREAQMARFYRKMQAKNQKYTGKYSQVVTAYRELEKERDRLKEVLTKCQDKSFQRISELREQARRREEAAREARMERDELATFLQEKEEVVKVLQMQVGILKSRFESERAAADDFSGKSNEEENLKVVMEENSVLKEKVSKMSGLLSNCKATIIKHREEIKELQAANEQLEQKGKDDQLEMSALKAKVEDLVAELRTQLERQEENSQKLERDFSLLREEREALVTRAEEATGRLGREVGLRESAERALAELQAESAARRERIGRALGPVRVSGDAPDSARSEGGSDSWVTTDASESDDGDDGGAWKELEERLKGFLDEARTCSREPEQEQQQQQLEKLKREGSELRKSLASSRRQAKVFRNLCECIFRAVVAKKKTLRVDLEEEEEEEDQQPNSNVNNNRNDCDDASSTSGGDDAFANPLKVTRFPPLPEESLDRGVRQSVLAILKDGLGQTMRMLEERKKQQQSRRSNGDFYCLSLDRQSEELHPGVEEPVVVCSVPSLQLETIREDDDEGWETVDEEEGEDGGDASTGFIDDYETLFLSGGMGGGEHTRNHSVRRLLLDWKAGCEKFEQSLAPPIPDPSVVRSGELSETPCYRVEEKEKDLCLALETLREELAQRTEELGLLREDCLRAREELDRASDENAGLRNELSESEDRYDRLCLELSGSEARLSELSDEVRRNQLELNVALEDNLSLKDEHEKLLADLRASESARRRAEEGLTRLRSDYQLLQEDHEATVAGLAELRESESDLRRLVGDLRPSLAACEEDRDKVRGDLAKSTRELEELNSKLRERTELHNGLLDALGDSEGLCLRLESEQAESLRLLEAGRAELAGSRAEREKLEREIDSLRWEINREKPDESSTSVLRSKVKETEDELGKVREEFDKVQIQLEFLKGSLDKAMEDNAGLEDRLQAVSEDRDGLIERSRVLESDLKDKEGEIVRLEGRLLSTSSELLEKHEAIERALRQQLDGVESKVRSLEEELEAAKTSSEVKLQESAKEARILRADLESSEAERRKADEAIKSLKQDLQKSLEKGESLGESLARAVPEDEVKKWTEERARLESKLLELEGDLEASRDEIRMREKSRVEAEREISELRGRIDLAEAGKERLGEDLKAAEDGRQLSRTEMEKLAGENETLREEVKNTIVELEKLRAENSGLRETLEKESASAGNRGKDLEERIEALKEEIRRHVSEREGDLKMLDETRRDNEAAKVELESSRGERDALLREVETLKGRLRESEESLARSVSGLGKDREMLEAKISELTLGETLLKEELESARKSLQEAEDLSKKIVAQHEDDLGILLKEKVLLESSADDQKSKIRKLEEKLREVSTSNDVLTSELKTAELDLVKVREEYGLKVFELESMKEEKSRLENEVKRLENEVKQLGERCKSQEVMESRESEWVAKMNELEEKLARETSASRHKDDSFEKRVKCLDEEICKLKRSSSESEERVARLSLERAEDLKMLEETRSGKEAAEVELLSLKQERGMLLGEIKTLKGRLGESEGSLERLASAHSVDRRTLEAKISDLASGETRLKEELERTRKSLLEAEDFSRKIKAQHEEDLGTLLREKVLLESSAGEQKSKIRKLEEKLREVSTSNDVLTSELKTAELDLVKVREESRLKVTELERRMREEKSRLENEVKQLEERCKSLEVLESKESAWIVKMNELEEKLATETSSSEERVARLLLERSGDLKMLKETRSGKEAAEKELLSLKQERGMLLGEIETLKGRLGESEGSLERVKMRHEEDLLILLREKLFLENSVEEQKSKITKLEEKLKEVSASNDGLTSELFRIREESGLEAKLRAELERSSGAEKEALEDEMKRLTEHLEEKSKSLEALEGKESEWIAKTNELKRKAEAKFKQLKRQKEEAGEKAERLKTEIGCSEEERDALRRRGEEAEARLAETEARLAETETRLVEIEARLVETEAHLVEAGARAGKGESLERRLGELEEESEGIRKKNQSLKQELRRLRDENETIVKSAELDKSREIERLKREYDGELAEREEEHNSKIKHLLREFQIKMAEKEKEYQDQFLASMERMESEVELRAMDLEVELKEAREELQEKDGLVDEKSARIEELMQTIGRLKSEEEWKELEERSRELESRCLELSRKVSGDPKVVGSPKTDSDEEEEVNHSIKELQLNGSQLSLSSEASSIVPMEFEYLKTVLYRYMVGSADRQTLTKVLCKIMRFSEAEEKQVMEQWKR